MTSVIALAWALEPSADSLPAGQARPDAPALLPGSAPAPSFALVGSEPHEVRLRVARAARAASLPARGLTRGFMVLVAFTDEGNFPWVNPEARCPPGVVRRGHVRAPSDAANVRASGVVMGLGR